MDHGVGVREGVGVDVRVCVGVGVGDDVSVGVDELVGVALGVGVDVGGRGVKVGVAVIGLEVPHAHIHLIPMSKVGDLDFSKPKLQLSKEDLQDVADKISRAYHDH